MCRSMATTIQVIADRVGVQRRYRCVSLVASWHRKAIVLSRAYLCPTSRLLPL